MMLKMVSFYVKELISLEREVRSKRMNKNKDYGELQD